MSRIGLKPVALPEGVTCTLNEGTAVIKGSKGEVSVHLPKDVSVSLTDGVLSVKPVGEDTPCTGTTVANLINAVKGVTNGWKKELEVAGTGYRCSIKNGNVVMFLGYSHEITVAPVGKYTKITCPSETTITVEGCNRQQVGQTAALIYDCHRPDVYGNKGVHYKGQHMIKKIGKRAASGKK